MKFPRGGPPMGSPSAHPGNEPNRRERAMAKFKEASAFIVRRLKDGSAYQVLTGPQEHAPGTLIGDFPSETDAKDWIRKNSEGWRAKHKGDVDPV